MNDLLTAISLMEQAISLLNSVAQRDRVQTSNEKAYLRREEASIYLTDVLGLPTAKNSLNRMASQGGGPVFHYAGRIPLYAKSDLDEWANQKISAAPYNKSKERQIT